LQAALDGLSFGQFFEISEMRVASGEFPPSERSQLRPSRLAGLEKEKRMATLTETDALAACLAPELMAGTKTFGADQAERANKRLFNMAIKGEVDPDTGARVGARIGNHSAMRQWAVKQGFLPASDAPEDALAKAVKAIHAKIEAAGPAGLLEPKGRK
jgi:hypothetical protein